MPVTTHIDQASERVQAEQAAVDAKLEAFDAFIDRVEDLSPEPTPSASAGITATAGALSRGTASTEDRCRTVRTAFAETISPHSVADVEESESLLETIQNEFSDSIAVALAPTTDTSFTPELKGMVVSAATTRRAEAEVLREALSREAAHLENAGDTVETITTWIADADETPLTDLGFEALQERHETLASHREYCDDLARERQAFLQQTTNQTVEIGVRHKSLIPYLYQDFSVDHPLLATVARLDNVCAECQRTVRQHLVRRA